MGRKCPDLAASVSREKGFLPVGFGLQHSGDGHFVCKLTGHSSHDYQLSAIAIAAVHDRVTVGQLHESCVSTAMLWFYVLLAYMWSWP